MLDSHIFASDIHRIKTNLITLQFLPDLSNSYTHSSTNVLQSKEANRGLQSIKITSSFFLWMVAIEIRPVPIKLSVSLFPTVGRLNPTLRAHFVKQFKGISLRNHVTIPSLILATYAFAPLKQNIVLRISPPTTLDYLMEIQLEKSLALILIPLTTF